MPDRRLSTIPEQRQQEELGEDAVPLAAKDRTLSFTSLYYLFIIIGIGVPVWYKMTAPVRYSLPDVPALMVHAQMMVHHVPVTVILAAADETHDEAFADDLQRQLSSQWPRKVSTDGSMSFTMGWKGRMGTVEELDILSLPHNISVIDNLLSEMESNDGEIRVFLVDQKVLGSGVKLLAGLCRSLFLPAVHSDDDSLSEIIFSSIEYLIEPSSGKSFLASAAESAKQKHVTSEPLIDPNISMWINFVMEDPLDGLSFQSNRLKEVHAVVDTAVTWSNLDRLLNLKIRSQMVYFAIDASVMDAVISKNQNVVTGERLIDTRNMPVLINSIENRVVEPDNKQSFYLNVIVPSASKPSEPLLFVDESDQSKSNILLTAAKGGFLIWNQDPDFNLGFKLLIRKLLGLNQLMPAYLIRKDAFFSDWELDSIKRSVCQKQILKSLSSLESIEKLLGKVSNIVIGQQVSERMHEAVDESHKAIDCLASGRLSQAYMHSCTAFQLSESAFYDPSLLALLYFPDDQKYAVYFPLFLPVSLPLLSSVYHLIRSARRP